MKHINKTIYKELHFSFKPYIEDVFKHNMKCELYIKIYDSFTYLRRITSLAPFDGKPLS